MVANKQDAPQEAIVIRVNLTEHLATLQAEEARRPLNQRRKVPSISELARATGINRASLYNWAGNKYESTRHDILVAVINELRRQGFSTEVEDLLKEHPASTVKEAA